MKLPCKQCICYPICRGNDIESLLNKCDIILDYVHDRNTAINVLVNIKPPYYYVLRLYHSETSYNLNLISRADQMILAKNFILESRGLK